jgi:hypothetical protein
VVVDKGVGGYKKFPHMMVGIEVFHTLVVVRVVDHGEWCYQSVHLLNETSRFVLAKWHRFWEIRKYSV